MIIVQIYSGCEKEKYDKYKLVSGPIYPKKWAEICRFIVLFCRKLAVFYIEFWRVMKQKGRFFSQIFSLKTGSF